MEEIRRLPYGISDFIQIREENLYYLDKTQYLELMERTDNFLFLTRPRRFGKSSFLTMMEAYYDVNLSGRFDELFGGLYVHEHSTKERNSYQVIHLDFSQVTGDSSHVQQNFETYGCLQWDRFAHKYQRFYPEGFYERVLSLPTFAAKLTYITGFAKDSGYKLYLIVDEYDNFTNNILNLEGEEIYHALTHASGFYRGIFKLFKPNFTRIFMMGVSPVTLDDLTSGYNIATNVTLRGAYNLMLGFPEDDVRRMIAYYQEAGMLKADADAIIADMKPWYDNYCFSRDAFGKDAKVFNCDMVEYYLNSFIQTGHAPESHIDPNTKTDYTKLKKIVRMGGSKKVVDDIVDNGYIYSSINGSFPAEELLAPDNFISLLYYYGMLTIAGVREARLKLAIPNNNVREQYYAYLRSEYSRHGSPDTRILADAFDLAAFDGEWEQMIKAITDAYANNSSVRDAIEGERNMQGFMAAYLSLNPYYLLNPEMEVAHGFADFFLMPDTMRWQHVAHSYIIELKYLRREASESEAERQWQEAVGQIRKYVSAPKIPTLLHGSCLHAIIVQVKGWELLRMEEI